jgi:hypothetical protein
MKFICKEFYLNKEIKTLPYWRNAIKEEIKLGYGATHHRDFDIADCYTEEGVYKLKFRGKDDGLLYYSSNYESYITRSNKIKPQLNDMYMPDWE